MCTKDGFQKIVVLNRDAEIQNIVRYSYPLQVHKEIDHWIIDRFALSGAPMQATPKCAVSSRINQGGFVKVHLESRCKTASRGTRVHVKKRTALCESRTFMNSISSRQPNPCLSAMHARSRLSSSAKSTFRSFLLKGTYCVLVTPRPGSLFLPVTSCTSAMIFLVYIPPPRQNILSRGHWSSPTHSSYVKHL